MVTISNKGMLSKSQDPLLIGIRSAIVHSSSGAYYRKGIFLGIKKMRIERSAFNSHCDLFVWISLSYY